MECALGEPHSIRLTACTRIDNEQCIGKPLWSGPAIFVKSVPSECQGIAGGP